MNYLLKQTLTKDDIKSFDGIFVDAQTFNLHSFNENDVVTGDKYLVDLAVEQGAKKPTVKRKVKAEK